MAPKLISPTLDILRLTLFILLVGDKQMNNCKLKYAQADQTTERPNIVIIMADDLGFDDVSFRGSNQFLTPNIDALAYSGVILKNMYTPAMCTPSRSALLTGKYPINTGMQHYVIRSCEPWGLPLHETTMAEIFQQHGYFTSLFGKWHLGMAKRAFTPTMRGFDKHFGYLGPFIDYYHQTLPEKNYSLGHDFRDNLHSTKKYVGTYVTNLLTNAAVKLIGDHNATDKPLFMILSHLAPHAGNFEAVVQAPESEINKFSYIKDIKRRTYAAMISLLDESVGQVIDALYRKKILENTIILFFSDNGGPTVGLHATTASNFPLKGQKNSPWEGGIRSSAAIWSTKIEKLKTVCKQRFYVADILPTLATAAGLHLQFKLDGIDLWSALKYGYQSVEREIVHNIDEIDDYLAYISGKWKLVNGTVNNGIYDKWLGTRDFENEIDPRSHNYDALIRKTTVWQQLNAYGGAIDAAAAVDIKKLREDAAVTCLYKNETEGIVCDPLNAPCLFDIDNDPCEQNNLYEQQKNSKLVQQMIVRIENFRVNARSPENLPEDPHCDPAYYNNEWTWWLDEPKSQGTTNAPTLATYCLLILLTFSYLKN